MGGKSEMKRTRVSKNSGSLPLGNANRSEDPLSNYVVLQNIFSYLDNTDIETCCQVNKCWNSIADPLLVRYYNITIGSRWRLGHSAIVSIEKILHRHNSRLVGRSKCSLEDASKFLQSAAKTERVAFNWTLSFVNQHLKKVTNFLSKFGQIAEKLTVEDTVTTRRFCEMLVRFFPNIKCLDLTLTWLEDVDDLVFDENLLENRMKSLKRIDHRKNSIFPRETWVNIFRMCPNLEEINNFPVLRVDALVATGKGPHVKSLTYPRDTPEGEFRRALQKLANLELKLRSFNFLYPFGIGKEDFLCIPDVQPFVSRMLESSCDSLEHLSLYMTEPFNFQTMRPMRALKMIKFLLHLYYYVDSNIRFFSAETSLTDAFPNVSTVKIRGRLCDHSVSRIVSWFPENQFAPWAVQKLQLEGVNLEILEVFSRSFPAVTDVELRMGIKGDGLQRIIPALSDLWPQLEVLGIRFLNFEDDQNKCTFDSLFTGIPDRNIKKLLNTDPGAWNTLFSPEQIEHWKQGSTLRKFSRLKVLKFTLNVQCNSWECKLKQKLTNISLVSKEFGFQFLPGLQIVLRMPMLERFKDWPKDIKTCLEPFVDFKLETFTV